MARQLVLLDPSDIDWRLDDRTKELGRRGLAEARSALRLARSGLEKRRAGG